MNFAELGRRCEVDKNTATLWWNRRDEFEKTAVLLHKPRMGRPVHKSFNTPQKLQKAFDICEDLPQATQSRCSQEVEMFCQHSPQIHETRRILDLSATSRCQRSISQNQEEASRIKDNLTKTGRRSKRLKNATMIDNKQVYIFGQNKTQ